MPETLQSLDDEVDALVICLARCFDEDEKRCFGIAFLDEGADLPAYFPAFLTNYGIDSNTAPPEKSSRENIEFWSLINLRMVRFRERHKDESACARMGPFYELRASFQAIQDVFENSSFIVRKEGCREGYLAVLSPVAGEFAAELKKHSKLKYSEEGDEEPEFFVVQE